MTMGNAVNHPKPPGPDRLRASDADRDRVAQLLGDALADGRLSAEEHSERLDALYAAKTLGELEPITADLGAAPAASSAAELTASAEGSENIVAVFASADRSGRWLVEPRTNASALFGSVSLDLREAVLAQREVVIQCAVIFGGLSVTVPHGVRVTNQTSAFLGGVDLGKVDSATDPNAPTVRLTGTCLLGGIEVRTKAPKRKRGR